MTVAGRLIVRVPDFEFDILRLAPANEIGNLVFKRSIAADMLAERRSVDKTLRVVIGGSDDDENALPLPRGRNGDGPPVITGILILLHFNARKL